MNVGHKNEQNFYLQRKIKSVKCFQSANSYHIDTEWKKNLVANLSLGWGSFNLLTQVYQREMLLFLLHFITLQDRNVKPFCLSGKKISTGIGFVNIKMQFSGYVQISNQEQILPLSLLWTHIVFYVPFSFLDEELNHNSKGK